MFVSFVASKAKFVMLGRGGEGREMREGRVKFQLLCAQAAQAWGRGGGIQDIRECMRI